MVRQYTDAERNRIEQALRDNPQFVRSLLDPDDFRAIIIGQTYIEAALNQLIDRYPEKKPKQKNYLNLWEKVKVAVDARELPDYWSKVILKLGAIRNDFAHKLGHREISPEKMDALRKALQEHNIAQMFGFFYLKQLLTDGNVSFNVMTDSVLVRATIMYSFELLIAAYEAQQSSSPSPFITEPSPQWAPLPVHPTDS